MNNKSLTLSELKHLQAEKNEAEKNVALKKADMGEFIARSLNDHPPFPAAGESNLSLKKAAAGLRYIVKKKHKQQLQSGINCKATKTKWESSENIPGTNSRLLQKIKNISPEKMINAWLKSRKNNTEFNKGERPESVIATQARNSCSLLLKWSRVKGAGIYVVRQTIIIGNESKWKQLALKKRLSVKLEELPMGSICWFEVATAGLSGRGPWSEAVGIEIK